MSYLVVFLGAGLGGALRHGVNLWAARAGSGFPFGTMVINVVGSIMMGVLTGWFAARGGGPQALRLFLTTGVLGGFTTFSTFSLEAFLLWSAAPTGRPWPTSRSRSRPASRAWR